MDLSRFNLSHLPEIFALSLVILCCRPLVRRAGPHVNLWFAGWFLLFLHYVLETFIPAGVDGPALLVLPIRWTYDLCLLSFVVAAETDLTRRIRYPAMAILAGPLFFQSSLIAFSGGSVALYHLSVILFVVAGLYLLIHPRKRTQQTIILGGIYLAIAGIALALDPIDPTLVNRAELSLIMLSAAWLFFRSYPHFHRGVVLAIAGMATWALTYPVLAFFAIARHLTLASIHPPRAFIELPIYVMAGGIILTVLEEHIRSTERLAMHDPLTNLPNRRMFEERLADAFQYADRHNTSLACVAIDIDNFKTINDTLGHAAGDQVLRTLAVRLAWHLGPPDLLARTGGDEYTALLTGVRDDKHLRFVASAMMSAVSLPILADGKPVEVHLSIGIALWPDHARDSDSLRRAADQAMYSAKRRGGSHFAFAGEEAS